MGGLIFKDYGNSIGKAKKRANRGRENRGEEREKDEISYLVP